MNTSSQWPISETPNYFNFCETLQIPEARSSFQTRLLLSFASLTNGQSRETDPNPERNFTFGQHKNPSFRLGTKKVWIRKSGGEPDPKARQKGLRDASAWYGTLSQNGYGDNGRSRFVGFAHSSKFRKKSKKKLRQINEFLAVESNHFYNWLSSPFSF